MDGIFPAHGTWTDPLDASLTFPLIDNFTFSTEPRGTGESQVRSWTQDSAQGSGTKLTLRTIFCGLFVLCLDLPKQITKS